MKVAPYDFLYQIAIFGAILVVTAVASRLSSVIIRSIFRGWIPVVRSHVQRFVTIVIWIVGVMLAVQQLGLRVDFLILLLGLVGAGALIAFWKTLENMGARYFSDVYVPFKVGDIIKVGNSSGKVIEINPITTVLLAEDESLVSVPNSMFLRERIENLTPHLWKEILIPITLEADVSLPEFESEVLKAANRMRRYLDQRFPPVLTVKDRSKRSVNLVLTLMIQDPSKKNEIIGEISEKISEIEDRLRNKQ